MKRRRVTKEMGPPSPRLVQQWSTPLTPTSPDKPQVPGYQQPPNYQSLWITASQLTGQNSHNTTIPETLGPSHPPVAFRLPLPPAHWPATSHVVAEPSWWQTDRHPASRERGAINTNSEKTHQCQEQSHQTQHLSLVKIASPSLLGSQPATRIPDHLHGDLIPGLCGLTRA